MRHGNAHPNIAPYEAFAARDGHVVVAVGNDAQFARLLGVLGLEDPDRRFATNPMRVVARTELATWLGERIATWDRASLTAALRDGDVPAGPVNSVAEAVRTMGEGWTERLGDIELAPSPIRIGDERAPLRRPPPRLGEHTDEVLAELQLRG